MTIHPHMFDRIYPTPLVWRGEWMSPAGLSLSGFHVWNRRGSWHGVYQTQSRAQAEAKLLI